MSRQRRIALWIWIVSLLACETRAVTRLTLEQSVGIALDKSTSVKQLKESLFSAEQSLWAAKAGYRTYVQSTLYLPAYDEGFKLVETVQGNPVAKKYGSLEVHGLIDVVQPMPWIPWGGGDMTLRSEGYQLNSWTPSPDDPNALLKSNQFYTSMSMILTKPLFTINETKLGLKRAELAYERESFTFKRSELDLVFQVTSAFYQVYSRGEILSIARDKVSRQEDIYETTKNKFTAGLIAEVDAMQAEVDLIQCRNDFKQAEADFKETEAGFKQLIGIPLDDPVELEAVLEPLPVVVDEAEAVSLALKNRSELGEKAVDIAGQEISIEETDARVSIKGNLKGYYNFAGFSDPDLPWGSRTGDLFRSSWESLRKTPNRGVTFELDIPLWDWGRNRAEVEAAQAGLRQQRLALEDLKITIEREVRDAVRNVSQSWDRVQMLIRSRKVGERSFEISLARFANGDITSVELARASDQLNQAKLSYLAAYIEYQTALADIRRKTLYDFEKKEPLVK
jgi:outer membrane protein TolC